jgi:hypothetical protein
VHLTPEDVLTRKQLDALDAQEPERHRGNMEAARQMGITIGGLKQRRTRARRILIIAGLDPQWKKGKQ